MALHRRPLFGVLLLMAAALCFGPVAARALAAPVPAVSLPAGCTELIQNGGFETNDAWQLGVSPSPAQYVTSGQHSGSRALQLGIIGGPNRLSFSSARQTVTIPADATQAQLSFWYYAVVTGAPAGDYMEMTLLSADGYTVLRRLWYSQADSRAWNPLSFDLLPWRGQTVQVYFNTFNDGTGGTAGMLLDDVSLVMCTGGAGTTVTPTATGTVSTATVTPTPSPIYITASPTTTPTPSPSPIYVTASPTTTPTPSLTPNFVVVTLTPTPTPNYVVATSTPTIGVVAVTASPTPTGTGTTTPSAVPSPGTPPANCLDLIQNGGFEAGDSDWYVAPDKLQAQLEMTNVHSGAYAMQLGTNSDNIYSYSSVRQQVTLPSGYSQLYLDYWTWTWAEGPAGSDHQEAVLLQPDPAIIKKVWRGLFNDRNWVEHSIPLIQYAGRTVVVYFNVVNDGAGGRSGMYLDDVHLWACGQYGQGQTWSGGAAPTQAAPTQAVVISGGQPLVINKNQQIVIVQVPVTVPVTVVVPGSATAPIQPPGIVVTATPLAAGSAAGPTTTALNLTATPSPSGPLSLTITPMNPAPLTPAVQPAATPAPQPAASWFSQFLSSARSNLPGSWLIGLIIVALAILGVIWLLGR
jgi:hypothetical protein